MNHLIEELRPNQIMDVVNGSSMVFIPVSPRYEWHSYQLPIGTDGIIAEEVAILLAEKFKAVYFRTLSVALDEVRSPEFKTSQGVPEDADVYGMNFPGLPVKCEYHKGGPSFMREAVKARLDAVRETGFKYAFLMNGHGGVGQQETLDEIAKENTQDGFKVTSFCPTRLNTFEPAEPNEMYLKVGGHAGLRETHMVMAFRPDLVDLSEVPEGDLKAAEQGILHSSPIIPEEYNPRHALESIALKVRKSILENCIKFVEEAVE